MSLLLRRKMMQKAGNSSIDLIQVTINSEPATPNECIIAIRTAVNIPNANFIAFVDDYAYMSSGGNKCVCVINSNDVNNHSFVYINDSNYGYMRRYASGNTAIQCNIPIGTIFNVFIYPSA